MFRGPGPKPQQTGLNLASFTTTPDSDRRHSARAQGVGDSISCAQTPCKQASKQARGTNVPPLTRSKNEEERERESAHCVGGSSCGGALSEPVAGKPARESASKQARNTVTILAQVLHPLLGGLLPPLASEGETRGWPRGCSPLGELPSFAPAGLESHTRRIYLQVAPPLGLRAPPLLYTNLVKFALPPPRIPRY